jgi:hypothetical protein
MPIPSLFTRFGVVFGCATLLWACDGGAEPPTEVDFRGVTYHAIGEARLRLAGGVLEVSDIGVQGGDGVRVDVEDGELDSLGVEIQPLELGTGARWGITAFGQVGGVRRALAAAWAEDIGGGRNNIQVSFGAGLGLDSLAFEYLLDGVLVTRSPNLPTEAGLTTLVTSAGTSNLGPNSVHAVREGGVVVIGTDYRSDELTGGTTAGLGCTAALIQVSFQPDPVCADYVRAVPRPSGSTGVPPANSAEIEGRRIDRFIITDGSVD